MKNLVCCVVAITVLHYAASQYTFHYDDFCEQTEDEFVIQFNKILQSSLCVCFPPGTYAHSKTENCPDMTFRTSVTTCVEIPKDVKSLKRLNAETAGEHADVGAHFPECLEAKARRKRDAAAPASSNSGNGTLDSMDEDFSSQGKEIGKEVMRNQMNQYIESVIAKLTGLQGEGGSTNGNGAKHKYPVIKLMEYTKQIMQKTCTVVNPDFFDLALNSFINLQLETYHIKEPYIGYSAFKRIEQAMTRCLQRATPHMFALHEVENSTGGEEMCDNHIPTKSSNQTVLRQGTEDEEIRQITIPPYASAELEPGKIAEPLIESVWKMLVSAHSFCYMYFSDYFNDHHTYTVSLLPLFTNQIQDIWLNEANGTKGYDLKDPEKNKLYGGLLGDVIGVLRDVDHCVGASRVISPYPWFMNRPLRDSSNEWAKRKKRSVESVKSHLVTLDTVINHECKLSSSIC